MRRKTMLVYVVLALVIAPVNQALANSANSAVLPTANAAELFGLSFNDLKLVDLAQHLKNMGLQSYPTYKEGIVSYGLGPEGILGITNATLYTNPSGYVRQALLTGVIQSNEKRKAIGDVFFNKYGAPSEGFLNKGIGRSKWLFDDGTEIDFRNTTYDVSILYVDLQPKKSARNSGRIDVEALSRKSR
ncbi:uridine kinase [Marinomonas hwangdonensis]|uniref:Uridine kinase n=1 Tax=Marinomonas hwangdonensis TaxID=1053647 RepID=A0A3M8Q6K8_9GAMM|nr:uridine kinase [Marinomonas hwangdonensis]RNF51462.1 uridine kinase [Marinomonas hwangdonensis]